MKDRLFIIYRAVNKGRAYLQFMRRYDLGDKI